MELRLPTDDDAPVASAYVTAPSSTVISDIAVTSPGLAMLQQAALATGSLTLRSEKRLATASCTGSGEQVEQVAEKPLSRDVSFAEQDGSLGPTTTNENEPPLKRAKRRTPFCFGDEQDVVERIPALFLRKATCCQPILYRLRTLCSQHVLGTQGIGQPLQDRMQALLFLHNLLTCSHAAVPLLPIPSLKHSATRPVVLAQPAHLLASGGPVAPFPYTFRDGDKPGGE